MTDTHQRQVLDDLVAQRAGADDHDLSLFDLLALPPGDEVEGAQAVGAQVGDVERLFRGDRQAARAGGDLAGSEPGCCGAGVSRSIPASSRARAKLAASIGSTNQPTPWRASIRRLSASTLRASRSGGAADGELLHQLTLGGKLAAGLERAVQHGGNQLAGDDFGEGFAGDRVDCHEAARGILV